MNRRILKGAFSPEIHDIRTALETTGHWRRLDHLEKYEMVISDKIDKLHRIHEDDRMQYRDFLDELLNETALYQNSARQVHAV